MMVFSSFNKKKGTNGFELNSNIQPSKELSNLKMRESSCFDIIDLCSNEGTKISREAFRTNKIRFQIFFMYAFLSFTLYLNYYNIIFILYCYIYCVLNQVMEPHLVYLKRCIQMLSVRSVHLLSYCSNCNYSLKRSVTKN